jgi:hypothetical protein
VSDGQVTIGQLSSLSTITLSNINPNTGAAALLLEAAISKHQNNPQAMKERLKG